jgi:hypothetical protein
MPSVLPLRAIALQILFLLIAIAIESSVLYRQLKISPRESVQYAATINLLSAVLGWLVIFTILNTGTGGTLRGSIDVEIALINLLLFNQASSVGSSVTGFLLVAVLATFPISFAVKQLGLMLLKWVLDPVLAEATPPPEPEVRSVMREPKKNVREESSPQILAVFLASLLSYAAIVLLWLLLVFAQGGITL